MIDAESTRNASSIPQFTEERIDQFVERQQQLRAKLENEGRQGNQTVAELVKKSKPLPPEIVDNIFNPYLRHKVSTESINDVRKKLHSMRLKINTLDPKKRFLILETMDFFRSKISIGKLIPAILLLQDIDKKKAFLQFVVPTFVSINKNIEILVSTKELFTKETLHLNRGSLYSFVSDLAKLIIPVFKPEYLKQYSNIVSPVELLFCALKPFTPIQTVEGDARFRNMIDDDTKIRSILLDFIVAIQSHDALFNYAIKRHGFYKLFLVGLTAKERFEESDPYLISKILAGCFIGNEQIKPAPALINAMIDKEKYHTPATTKAKKSFIDKLAPSTVIGIINEFKTHFKLLIKSKPGDVFADVTDLSAVTILKKVWSGFAKLAEGGLSKLAAPLEIVLNQIIKTFRSFVEDEIKEEEQAKGNLNKPVTVLIPKRAESLDYLKKNYFTVIPDIAGFRGVREGANQKDFAYNARFFKKGEITLLEFTYCFKRLFEFLIKKGDKKVKTVTHDKQKGIVEYHAAFLYQQYLICLGLTRLKSEKSVSIQEKDIFPYVLLFSASTKRKAGRIPSRSVSQNGKQVLFNETVLLRENSKVFYKSILYILHLLPPEDWNSSASQACIKFIIRELKRLSQNPKR